MRWQLTQVTAARVSDAVQRKTIPAGYYAALRAARKQIKQRLHLVFTVLLAHFKKGGILLTNFKKWCTLSNGNKSIAQEKQQRNFRAERGRRVVRITVEVGNGAARYRVAVQAESIRRVLEIVEGLYPGGDFRVKFPIDPQTFFVKDPAAAAGPVEQENRAA